MMHNLKIFFRNSLRKPLSTIINMLGLAIGIACFVITAIYINYHLTFDAFHDHAGDIYTVTSTVKYNNFDTEDGEKTPAPLAAILANNYPEIKAVARLSQDIEGTVKVGEKTYIEKQIAYADSSFFDVFTYRFIEGSAVDALLEPNSVVLTEQIAKKYFNDEVAIGSLIELFNRVFKVTAIIENPPPNSILKFDLLFSLHTFKYYYNNPSWKYNRFHTYFVLNSDVDLKNLNQKILDISKQYVHKVDGIEFKEWLMAGNKWEYHLVSIKKVYLDLRNNRNYLNGFAITASLLLFIACINYINLNTAKAGSRAMEVGLKKTMGANRKRLIYQFLGESIVMSFLSLIIAMGIVEAVLPLLSEFLDVKLIIHYFKNVYTLPSLLSLAFVVGLISGVYPAFVLTSYVPIKVLKGNTFVKKSRFSLRSILVFLQFAISTCLVITSFFVYQQTQLLMNKDVGFNKENLMVVRHAKNLTIRKINPYTPTCNTDIVRAEFLKIPEIENVTFSGRAFNHDKEEAQETSLENGKKYLLNWFMCDPDYAITMKIHMHSGRFFDRKNSSDLKAAVINKTALDYFKWDAESLDQVFEFPTLGKFKLIGVINDFHYQPLHYEIKPLLFLNHEGPAFFNIDYFNIRLKRTPDQETIKKIESVWKKFVSDVPFEYFMLDDQDKLNYIKEERTKQLFLILTILVLIITYIGIYGLVTYSNQVKTKEIAIRKAIGATINNIILKISWNFTWLVLTSNILAWPLAWYFMNDWLNGFATRINMSWWIFILAAICSYILAILTIIFQAYSAARRNPVDVLRYE